jgi:hypothetical protein
VIAREHRGELVWGQVTGDEAGSGWRWPPSRPRVAHVRALQGMTWRDFDTPVCRHRCASPKCVPTPVDPTDARNARSRIPLGVLDLHALRTSACALLANRPMCARFRRATGRSVKALDRDNANDGYGFGPAPIRSTADFPDHDYSVLSPFSLPPPNPEQAIHSLPDVHSGQMAKQSGFCGLCGHDSGFLTKFCLNMTENWGVVRSQSHIPVVRD